MLRLSKLTDYAVVVMVQLSRQTRTAAGGEGGVSTAPCLAQATGIPEPTVAKVLKALAASGLVSSQRGARGGYRLARALSAVAIAEVITAIDGPISMTACVDGATGGCEAQTCCPIRGRWDPVNDAIRATLSSITLDSMDKAFDRLQMPHAPSAEAPAGAPPGAPVHAVVNSQRTKSASLAAE
ncbi:SUF system Fe-S cluster assembly regulator [Acetobacteraceae bacterium KSS8]|uniref:SUF system Fe-S cluster assembly regulator n=1 Tax=Endosaccharibacter trunci TaxID=2812733 RepID=A0ABT1W5K3_9PROT|nr:SUF system Fe-S cluster assembly regulator [Acetobacteraceae bacterium KSS8]